MGGFLSAILGIVVFGGFLFLLWRGMSDVNRRMDNPQARPVAPDIVDREKEHESDRPG